MFQTVDALRAIEALDGSSVCEYEISVFAASPLKAHESYYAGLADSISSMELFEPGTDQQYSLSEIPNRPDIANESLCSVPPISEPLTLPNEEAREADKFVHDPCNLYVKGLDTQVVQGTADLLAVFEPFGKVASAHLALDSQGKSRGFGFVCFTTPKEALTAKNALHGSVQGSQTLYVSYAERKSDRISRLTHLFKTTQATPATIE